MSANHNRDFYVSDEDDDECPIYGHEIFVANIRIDGEQMNALDTPIDVLHQKVIPVKECNQISFSLVNTGWASSRTKVQSVSNPDTQVTTRPGTFELWPCVVVTLTLVAGWKSGDSLPIHIAGSTKPIFEFKFEPDP